MIESKRLILRQWNREDIRLFAKICADPKVMEYFPSTLTLEESAAFVEKIEKEFEERGFGLWAVEVKEGPKFIGFIGLRQVSFMDAIEIGWRLGKEHWGKGYASEGARKVLEYAFDTLKLDEVVSFTAVQNSPSRRVMEKIGMTHNPHDDFNHPALPKEHPLSRHVLYRCKNNL